MSETNIEVVPFGKYKGKPITELISDQNYCNWLSQQEWFSKYKTIYMIVVQNKLSNVDTPTPEHNKMQNLFLKDEYKQKIICKTLNIKKHYQKLSIILKDIGICDKDIDAIMDDVYIETKKYFNDSKCLFEAEYNWDIKLFNDTNRDLYILYKIQDALFNKIKELQLIDKLKGRGIRTINGCISFYDDEKQDTLYIYTSTHILYIELKTVLGDDYPCVLRKMKQQIEYTQIKDHKSCGFIKNNMYILLIDKFQSQSASYDELKTIFKQHNIKVLTLKEIEDEDISM